jgi:AmmeMemoRadiSam system protein B
MIRPAYFAGKSYFQDEGRLRSAVVSFIEDADQTNLPRPIQGLVVPQGALLTFGAIAGYAYKLLWTTQQTWQRVIVLSYIGDASDAVAIDPLDAYDTPIGSLEIDMVGRENLKNSALPIVFSNDTSPVIEAHLPFLITTLGNVSILPIRLGGKFNRFSNLADALKLSNNDLVIATMNLPPHHEEKAIQRIASAVDIEPKNGLPKKLTAWFKRQSNLQKPSSENHDGELIVGVCAAHLTKHIGATKAHTLIRDGWLVAMAFI